MYCKVQAKISFNFEMNSISYKGMEIQELLFKFVVCYFVFGTTGIFNFLRYAL